MRQVGLPQLSTAPLDGACSTLVCVDELVPTGASFRQVIPVFAIIATLAGEAETQADGRAFIHRPGRLFAVAPGVTLEDRVIRPWRVRYLWIEGPWCASLGAALRASGGAMMLDHPPRPWLTALHAAVDAGIAGNAGASWRLASALATLLGGLASEHGQAGDLLAELGRLIDAAPERAWGVTGLARRLRLSPRTLQKRFRTLGVPAPARWVLQRRMVHATLMLRRGSPVQDVAEALGFANPFHFSRAYKRACGAAPSQVRQP